MPIYEYECKKCGHRSEVKQSFSDEPVRTCRSDGCRGRVLKVLSPPAIVFKGSGFHVNDYGSGNGNGKRKSASEDKCPSTCENKDECEKKTKAAGKPSD